MSKVLVELYVPSIDKQYSFKIPNSIKIHELIKILNKMIKEESPEYYEDQKAVLCNQDTGVQFDINSFIGDSGIVNGSRMILI